MRAALAPKAATLGTQGLQPWAPKAAILGTQGCNPMCCRCVLLSQSDAFVYVPSSASTAALPARRETARGGGAGSQAAAERRTALATDPAS